MTLPSCPFCGKTTGKSIKNWSYNSIKVSRIQCPCGKIFNFYKSTKSSWTIPKSKKLSKSENSSKK